MFWKRGMASFGWMSDSPQRQLLAGYAIYSLLGWLLLLLPWCQQGETSCIDHLFTAVSGLSTTGLATVDVSTEYTFWGQLIILLLIQMGGLGYMTFASYVMLRITKHLSNNEARLFHTQFAFPNRLEEEAMLSRIVNFALCFEMAGCVLLFPYFLLNDVESPLWSAVFHSISAFCTAGFSIYTDNLMQFQDDWYVNLVIAALSYAGAMGFIMMTDVAGLFRKRRRGRISFTTKVIAVITTVMTLWSTLHLYFMEPSLQSMGVADRLLAAWFQSMSAITTVGFNTVHTDSLATVTMVVLSFCMYVGASPSGTGGGLKSTTLSALLAYTKNRLGLRKDISLAGNRVPLYRVDAALTSTVFYTLILSLGIYLMVVFEENDETFMPIVFEAASALATAGLSSGILSHICIGSKLVLIALMFIGRVGVITVGNVMLIRAHAQGAKHHSDLVV